MYFCRFQTITFEYMVETLYDYVQYIHCNKYRTQITSSNIMKCISSRFTMIANFPILRFTYLLSQAYNNTTGIYVNISNIKIELK